MASSLAATPAMTPSSPYPVPSALASARPPSAPPPRAGDSDSLAVVVEHLESELSRRESAERRLAASLRAAEADVEERDQHIADICAQWERSVTQMQAARDEDVAQIASRLDVEDVELASLRARAETRSPRRAPSPRARTRRSAGGGGARDAARGGRDRRLAAAAAGSPRVEIDRRDRDAETRRAAEAVELQRRAASELRAKERAWDDERSRAREEMEHVIAGAARFVRGEVLHKHRLADLPAEVAAATSVDEDAIRRILRRKSTDKERKAGEAGKASGEGAAREEAAAAGPSGGSPPGAGSAGSRRSPPPVPPTAATGSSGGGERPRDVRADRNRPAAAADAAVKGSSSRRGERRVERRRVVAE